MATRTAAEDEHEALRGMVWDLLRQRSSSAIVHQVIDAGDGVHRQLDDAFGDLGLFGIDAAEVDEGGGGTLAHLRHVVEGCGWAAATTRILGTTAGAIGALMACPSDEARRAWLPGLAAGRAGGAIALPGVAGAAGDDVTASRDGESILLRGRCSYVVDLDTADVVVVLARLEGEPMLVAVSTDDPTVQRERQETLDLTRSLGLLTLTRTSVADNAVLAAGEREVATCLERVSRRSALSVAADSLGIATRVLDETTTYLKEREQFGRPIGSFQAVKHQAADMLVRVEMSRALLDDAVLAYDDDRADASLLASMAKDYCCAAAAWVAGRGIQLHGGIGYTWEHDMHIYFKRAKLNEMLAGDARFHRRRVVELGRETPVRADGRGEASGSA